MGHRLHSDLNGALNILRRGSGILVEGDLRPLSFIVDHNGVVPTPANRNRIAPTKGGNAQDPGTAPAERLG
jgi:putative transposase